MNGSDAPVMAEANAHHVHLANGADLPFPGSAWFGPSPEGILPFDFNYDFKTDLFFAGDKGLRLFRQDQPDHFTDVTAAMKLPGSVINAAYTGAWAIDLEADGDLDVVLGTRGLERRPYYGTMATGPLLWSILSPEYPGFVSSRGPI